MAVPGPPPPGAGTFLGALVTVAMKENFSASSASLACFASSPPAGSGTDILRRGGAGRGGADRAGARGRGLGAGRGARSRGGGSGAGAAGGLREPRSAPEAATP